MTRDLSFVGDAGNGCRIYRESSGCYVVGHGLNQAGEPGVWVREATLAGAYARCQRLAGWRDVRPANRAARGARSLGAEAS